ncbi:hypothetical protein MMC13_006612 [Lambiella insularis]|nr:hypothetical protein [Lambiella insularis]
MSSVDVPTLLIKLDKYAEQLRQKFTSILTDKITNLNSIATYHRGTNANGDVIQPILNVSPQVTIGDIVALQLNEIAYAHRVGFVYEIPLRSQYAEMCTLGTHIYVHKVWTQDQCDKYESETHAERHKQMDLFEAARLLPSTMVLPFSLAPLRVEQWAHEMPSLFQQRKGVGERSLILNTDAALVLGYEGKPILLWAADIRALSDRGTINYSRTRQEIGFTGKTHLKVCTLLREFTVADNEAVMARLERLISATELEAGRPTYRMQFGDFLDRLLAPPADEQDSDSEGYGKLSRDE